MRIERDQMLLMIAGIIALRGTCSRAQVGAVASFNGRIICTGYNGTPSGLEHCEHQIGQPCDDAVHAEANLVAFAARHGVSLLMSTVHTTHAPCKKCAELLINAGVKRVVYMHPYRDPAGVQLLGRAKIEVNVMPQAELKQA